MGMLRIGTLIMAVFTVLWSSWAWPSPRPLLQVPGIAFALAAAVVAVVSLLRGRRGRGGSSQSKEEAVLDDAHRHPKQRGASRITVVAIIVEMVAIFAAVRWLSSANSDLIQPAIALIVGAHFLVFQLSPATRGGVHVVMAVLGVTVGAIGMLMINGDRPADIVHALVGLGMAAITFGYGVLFTRAPGHATAGAAANARTGAGKAAEKRTRHRGGRVSGRAEP
ncbi:DUF6609 family protein [Corynebacterium freneyi]|uniref:DUF6609 family protein n=1 Tax=Corynebacterium freneyi TaxID=134034 RepID=UPI001CCF4044|nr:DUF6609 family protein [Corynebacterium freneyi]UBI02414.1 hypothetical protein LA334_00705 [Corynebacterium freneyi]